MSLKQCKCRKAIEDNSHIVNSCEYNHKLITLRHDHLVGKIAKELKRSHKEAEILVERHWQQDLQLVKPDITLVKDGHSKIIEVTCRYESSIEYLEQRPRDSNQIQTTPE